mgnify:CR=1 FL=1
MCIRDRADAVGALAQALSKKGHDVRIVIPKYHDLKHFESAKLLEESSIHVQLGVEDVYSRVWENSYPDCSAKVYFLQYQDANEYYNRKAGYTAGSVHCFIDKKTGEVYKAASWKAPAKIVRFDLRLIGDREFLFNPNNISWAGSHLYLR